MIITPELKMKQQKILDIFKRMTLDEQYVVVGYLSEYADRNYAQMRAEKWADCTRQVSGKVIQFLAAVPV